MINVFKDDLRPASYWFYVGLPVTIQLAALAQHITTHSAFSLESTNAGITPPALVPVLVVGLLSMLPSRWKDSIAHFSLSDPLPGSEAFSRWAKKDPRINMEKFKGFGRIPKKGKAQNSEWYSKLYQPMKREPEVVSAHRKYLLFRDLAIIEAAIIICSLIGGVTAPGSQLIIGFSVALYAIFVLAAKNTGIRFVQTVMAIWQPKPS